MRIHQSMVVSRPFARLFSASLPHSSLESPILRCNLVTVPSQPGGVSNRILSSLPLADYQRLTLQARLVTLASGEGLYEANLPIPNVYFILNGIGSIITTMAEGTSIEVMVVGHEGIVGLPTLESPESSAPTTALMQVSGNAIEISSAAVRKEFSRGESLNSLLFQYLQFTLVQVSQSAACNRLHNLEERLARWLLMVHDRIQLDEFDITHEFLGQMLGTGRSSVTLAAGQLQRAGHMDYRWGHVRIADREGLETVACQCYPILKLSWNRLVNHAFEV
jgi:CRP-like cAMP-binding protein